MPAKQRHLTGRLDDVVAETGSQSVDCSQADVIMFFYETTAPNTTVTIHVSPDNVTWYVVSASAVTWAAAGMYAHALGIAAKFCRVRASGGPLSKVQFDAARTIA